MRLFLSILVLMFSLQSWTKADDIRDFEIEGMSVGDSLLKFINEDDILSNIIKYPYTSKKYYATSITESKYLKSYESLEVYLKKNDKKYIIYSIDAANFYKNKKKCLKKMDQIKVEISKIFSTLAAQDKKKMVNLGDPSGKSIYYRTSWIINNRDFVAIECSFWSQEMKDKYNFGDHIRVSVTKKELDDWLTYEAYE